MTNFLELSNLNDPACGYKFGWSTIRLWTNDTASCHRCDYESIPDNFNDFHNTPEKLIARMKMALGMWPEKGCEYCRDIEAVDGISDRMDFSNINVVKNKKLVPQELIENFTLKTSPTIVEVYFNNNCNMKCVYCNSGFSSLWEVEDIKFGSTYGTMPKRAKGYEERVEKWFNWLKINGQTLQEYNVLGGEPFYQDELQANIDLFKEHPHPNLKFRIFSNFKVQKDRFRKYLKDLRSLVVENKVGSVRLISSIDCWGEQQEYVRTGFKMEQWKENMDILIYEFPEIEIHCHGTMCALTLKTAKDLANIIGDYSKVRRIFQTYNLLVGPEFMQNSVFPYGFFDKDIKKLQAAITEYGDIHRANQILGYKDEFNSKPYEPEKIKELVTYLDTLDKRRNTNWKEVFPWLDAFIKQNFIELNENG